jgi:hypothetical protein
MKIILSNTDICIILVLCITYTEKLFRQWLHRMAFCAFMLCWGGSTFCKKITFCVLNDPEFPIEIQVYYNHFGCFNVTKIPLHRELFPSCFMTSW